jgi:hypothetical protein
VGALFGSIPSVATCNVPCPRNRTRRGRKRNRAPVAPCRGQALTAVRTVLLLNIKSGESSWRFMFGRGCVGEYFSARSTELQWFGVAIEGPLCSSPQSGTRVDLWPRCFDRPSERLEWTGGHSAIRYVLATADMLSVPTRATRASRTRSATNSSHDLDSRCSSKTRDPLRETCPRSDGTRSRCALLASTSSGLNFRFEILFHEVVEGLLHELQSRRTRRHRVGSQCGAKNFGCSRTKLGQCLIPKDSDSEGFGLSPPVE